MKIEKWSLPFIPYKIILALFSTFFTLFLIKLGYKPDFIGVVSGLMNLFSVFSSLMFGTLCLRSRNHFFYVLLGFLGLLFTLMFLLLSTNFVSILLSAFFFSFLVPATYFALISFINHNFKDVEKKIGNLESIGGFAWVFGLAIGCFVISFLSPFELLTYLLFATFFSLFVVFYSFGANLIERFYYSLLKDFGLLPWIEKLVEKTIKVEEKFFEKISYSLGILVSGSFSPSLSFIQIKKPRLLNFHLINLLIFFSFGLLYTQIFYIMKTFEVEDNFIFGFSLISSLLAAIFYSRANRVKNLIQKLKTMFILRIFMFLGLLPFLYFSLPKLFFLIFLLVFWILDGYTWGFIAILLNLFALKNCKEEFGVYNFFRSLGYTIGGFLSGVFAVKIGFQFLPLASTTLLFLVLLFFK